MALRDAQHPTGAHAARTYLLGPCPRSSSSPSPPHHHTTLSGDHAAATLFCLLGLDLFSRHDLELLNELRGRFADRLFQLAVILLSFGRGVDDIECKLLLALLGELKKGGRRPERSVEDSLVVGLGVEVRVREEGGLLDTVPRFGIRLRTLERTGTQGNLCSQGQ